MAGTWPATPGLGRVRRAAHALTAKLRQNQAAQKARILANEQIPPDLAPAAAPTMRAHIAERFAELYAERQQFQARLDTLTAVTPKAADTSLLDEFPFAGDVLPGMPDELKARLLAAFDIHVLWNKPGRQVTVHAEITNATPAGPAGYPQPLPGRLR